MLGFKGFDKDLKCRGKQYEIGQTYEEPEAKLCKKGLHFVLHPLDAFNYYPPANSRFAEIEADEVSDETKSSDSKRAAKKITVKLELSLKGLIDAAIKFVFEKATWNDSDKATGNRGAASATGYQGAASATGDQGAASATGNRGAASATGKNSIAVSIGFEGKAKASKGSWITLAEWKQNKKYEWNIKTIKTAKVDGERIKANTYYLLKDGKFVEAENESD